MRVRLRRRWLRSCPQGSAPSRLTTSPGASGSACPSNFTYFLASHDYLLFQGFPTPAAGSFRGGGGPSESQLTSTKGEPAGGGVSPLGGVVPPAAGVALSPSTSGAGGAVVVPGGSSLLLPLRVEAAGEGGIGSSSSEVESSDTPSLGAVEYGTSPVGAGRGAGVLAPVSSPTGTPGGGGSCGCSPGLH